MSADVTDVQQFFRLQSALASDIVAHCWLEKDSVDGVLQQNYCNMLAIPALQTLSRAHHPSAQAQPEILVQCRLKSG